MHKVLQQTWRPLGWWVRHSCQSPKLERHLALVAEQLFFWMKDGVFEQITELLFWFCRLILYLVMMTCFVFLLTILIERAMLSIQNLIKMTLLLIMRVIMLLAAVQWFAERMALQMDGYPTELQEAQASNEPSNDNCLWFVKARFASACRYISEWGRWCAKSGSRPEECPAAAVAEHFARSSQVKADHNRSPSRSTNSIQPQFMERSSYRSPLLEKVKVIFKVKKTVRVDLNPNPSYSIISFQR